MRRDGGLRCAAGPWRSGLLLLLLMLPTSAAGGAEQAKYVFLMIGDGMGVGQWELARRYVALGLHDENVRQLHMDRLLVKGTAATAAADGAVTDSAAAGTALASGEKTLNGVVGLDASKEKTLITLAEQAHQAGSKVALVTSVSIDHATPAVFYAHQASRGSYYEISAALADSEFAYFAGQPMLGRHETYRRDRPDPVALAQANGFTVVEDRAALLGLLPGAGKVLVSAAVPNDWQAAPDSVTLTDLVNKGIELLQGPQGFFMMIEGGKVDWACHSNDIIGCLAEMVSLDRAVQRVLAFYQAHPDETLVVITADHETGGLTLKDDPTASAAGLRMIAEHKNGREKLFEQIIAWRSVQTPWNQALPTVQKLYGFTALTDEERITLEKAYGYSVRGEKPTGEERRKWNYGKREALGVACDRILSARTGASWTTFGHTGADVPVAALGIGAEAFKGTYDNTELHHKLQQIMINR